MPILPPELVEIILLCLDAPDILRIQEVCRAFSRLIKESVRIQYKIECFVSRVEDGTVKSPAVRQRLEKLRAWRSLWHNGQFKLVRQLEREPPTGLVDGSVQARISEDNRGFSVESPAMSFRGLQEFHCDVNGLDFEVWDFFIEASHGLLMVLERMPNGIISIHLLAFDGKVHPSAAASRVLIREDILLESIFCTSNKTLLAITAENEEDTACYVWVRNWRTGEPVFHMHEIFGINAESVEFIDDRYLLIGGLCDSKRDARLIVLDCYGIAPDAVFTSLQDVIASAVLILELPPLKGEHLWMYLGFLLNPDETPGYRTARSRDAIFHPTSDSNLLWLSTTTRRIVYTQHGLRPEDAHAHILAIPLRVVRSRLPDHATPNNDAQVVCLWSDWASETRYFAGEIFSGLRHQSYLSRIMFTRERPTRDGEGQENVVVLHEFDSIYALRRDLASGDETKIASIITQPTMPNTACFDSTDQTCLPYREVVTNIVVPQGHSAILETEYIIVHSNDASRLYFYSL